MFRKQSSTLGVEWEGRFSLKDGRRGCRGEMGGRMFGNDVKHSIDLMVGRYGWLNGGIVLVILLH